MALAPVFASFGAYFMLGETLPAVAVIGIALTISGVAVVILEREEHSGEAPVSRATKVYGVICGLVAAIGQGGGLVLAKKGIDFNPVSTLNPVSATLMRMVLGALFACCNLHGDWDRANAAIADACNDHSSSLGSIQAEDKLARNTGGSDCGNRCFNPISSIEPVIFLMVARETPA
jgi:hypothetical protein